MGHGKQQSAGKYILLEKVPSEVVGLPTILGGRETCPGATHRSCKPGKRTRTT